MVKRSAAGTYDIPGSAVAESWDAVRAELQTVERWDDLRGWGGEWDAVYRCVNFDGFQVWYFVRERPSGMPNTESIKDSRSGLSSQLAKKG
jgi:hypothetical protein